MRSPRPPPLLWMMHCAGPAPALLAAACLVSYSVYRLTRQPTTPSPTSTRITPTANPSAAGPNKDGGRGTAGGGGGAEPRDDAYPPDAFPGARDVETSYGNIKVYEWGLEDGDKVLLVHGMSTPCLVLGDMAWELVRRGCRVMLYDIFGKGHSGAPADLPFDERLYNTQILHVLASSDLCWTGAAAFHIMGYSLGGAIATAFAAYHHPMLRSVTCVCPSGIMRSFDLIFEERLVVDWAGWVPERLLAAVLRPALEPTPPPPSSELPPVANPGEDLEWDLVPCSVDQAFPLVRDVLRWQLDNNEAYVSTYMSTLRHSPLSGEHQKSWKLLGDRMAANRVRGKGLQKLCLILGDRDVLLPPKECVQDAHEIFGEDGVEVHLIEGNHSIALTDGRRVAELALRSGRGGGVEGPNGE
ncbi:Monoacylglycerol lipase abhd6-B [Escovopsis weberi]|uniref:Monoacylglycerol lipase abhd6-B n=1 Tax=Escovopsis weberi TaxID=150374 RepID=A0A0M9VTT4_ESCWE|nr:Monoacylglycerol lipase abhd6-B [Escovopsis weberi]